VKLAFEVPLTCLEFFEPLEDYGFALSKYVLSDANYAAFFRKRSPTILDCMTYEEGDSGSFESILQAIDLIDPSAIIIPDTLYECDKTIEKGRNFIQLLKKTQLWKGQSLIGVLQGRTPDEYMKCLHFFRSYTDFFALPTSPRIGEEAAEGVSLKERLELRSAFRARILQQLRFESGESVHLLGIDNPIEVSFFKEFPFIVSADTSKPIKYGFADIMFEPLQGLPEDASLNVRKDMLVEELNRGALYRAAYNIIVMRYWLGESFDSVFAKLLRLTRGAFVFGRSPVA